MPTVSSICWPSASAAFETQVAAGVASVTRRPSTSTTLIAWTATTESRIAPGKCLLVGKGQPGHR